LHEQPLGLIRKARSISARYWKVTQPSATYDDRRHKVVPVLGPERSPQTKDTDVMGDDDDDRLLYFRVKYIHLCTV